MANSKGQICLIFNLKFLIFNQFLISNFKLSPVDNSTFVTVGGKDEGDGVASQAADVMKAQLSGQMANN
jgi:hypothetical protein